MHQHLILNSTHLISENVRPTCFLFDFKIISEVELVIICLVVMFFCFQCVQVEDLNIFSVIVLFFN